MLGLAAIITWMIISARYNRYLTQLILANWDELTPKVQTEIKVRFTTLKWLTIGMIIVVLGEPIVHLLFGAAS